MDERPDATVLHELRGQPPPQIPSPLLVLGEQLERTQHSVSELYRSHRGGITSFEALAAASGDGFQVLREALEAQLERLRDPAVLVQELRLVRKFNDTPISTTLPILTVGAIMGTLYVSFACVYMPVMGVATSGLSSIVFHSTFGMALWSYHQGVVTDPGGIPDSWVHEPEDSFVFVEKKKKNGGGLRFCSKEHKYKPDRAHYCSALRRNVLRMDHYCPWLGNCVGHRNQKHFILFLMYTVVATNMVDFSILRALFFVGGFSGGHTFMMIHGAFLSSLLSSVLTPFLGFHIWLLVNNMTTIEYCEKRGQNTAYVSPYDSGLERNLTSVLGEEIHLWLFPIGRPPGDGTHWSICGALDPWMLSEEDDEEHRRTGSVCSSSASNGIRPSFHGDEAHDRQTGRGLHIGPNGNDRSNGSSSGRPAAYASRSAYPTRRTKPAFLGIVPTDFVPGAMAAMRECSVDALQYSVAQFETCQQLCQGTPVETAAKYAQGRWTSFWQRSAPA